MGVRVCLHKVKKTSQRASQIKKKSNLRYMCGNTPKRVTGDVVHLCGLATGQHSSEEVLNCWSPLRLV